MRLDRSHPIARHLIGCWFSKDPAMQNLCYPTESNDVVSGSSTTPAPEDGGIRLDANCGFVTNTRQPALTADSNYFWLIKYKVRSNISGGNVIFGNRFQGSSSPLQFVKITENNVQFYNGGNDLNLVHDRTVGETYDLALVKEGSNFTLYIDGEVHITGTSSKTMASNPVYLANGSSAAISEATDIVVYHAMHGATAPTSEQIASLHANPEQVLWTPNDEYYKPAETGGAFTLTSDSGTYTYTGTNAELDAGFVLGAISGSYTYSGTNADLNYGFVIAADSGTYTYSGTAAELDAGFAISANSGSYTYSGTNADLNRGYPLSANSGTYTYSGTDVTLTFAGAGAFTLSADSGSYAYSGTNAELDAGLVLTADSGSYTYNGTTVTLTHNYPLAADSGSYTYSGTAAALKLTSVLAATSGSYAYTGSNVTLQASGQAWTVQTNDGSTWTVQSNDSSTWTIQ